MREPILKVVSGFLPLGLVVYTLDKPLASLVLCLIGFVAALELIDLKLKEKN